jgi:ligand-binding SRPBCC domain-containing protein
MPVIEESIVINREPKEVWDFATDYQNIAVIDSSQSDVEKLTDGPLEVGTRLRGSARVLGRQIPWTSECTVLETPHHMRIESVDAPLSFVFDYRYDSADGGTKATIRCETESGLGGVFGKFGDALVTRTYTKQLRANLETLKEIMEAE